MVSGSSQDLFFFLKEEKKRLPVCRCSVRSNPEIQVGFQDLCFEELQEAGQCPFFPFNGHSIEMQVPLLAGHLLLQAWVLGHF